MAFIKEITDAQLEKKVYEDLKRSGITPEFAKKLKIKPLGRDDFKKVDEKGENYGYEIPYFDLNGRLTKHSRYKILSKASNPTKKQKKYHQLPNTPSRVYTPPLKGTTWAKIAKDPEQVLHITEGEKKAACGCSLDLYTIGLGGVWSFMNAEKTNLMDDLLDFEWEGREVYIVFDNDVHTNAHVKKAKLTLATMLVSKGAAVFDLILPKGPLKGMDDFLVAKGADEFDHLEAAILEGDEIYQFNQECCFISEMCVIRHIPTGNMWDVGRAKHVFANRWISVLTEDGPKDKSLVPAWMAHEGRREFKKLVFRPGQPKEIDDCLNTYKDDRIEAVKGDVKPFIEMVNYLFQEPGDLEYILTWLAHKRRHPEIRLRTNLILYSISQQVGKSAFIEKVMFPMIGNDSCTTIQNHDLNDSNNSWLENKLLILAEEIRSHGKGSKSEELADKLKPLISQDKVRIREKYLVPYDIDNFANMVITSNSPTPFYMEPGDMRYYVIHINEERNPTTFYQKFYDWVRDGGAAHIAHYLDEYDLSHYNPNDPAPSTDAKEYSIEIDTPDYQIWLKEFIANGAVCAHNEDDGSSSKDFWTMEEIKARYEYENDDEGAYKVTKRALGQGMSRLGVVNRVMSVDGRNIRIYVFNLSSSKKIKLTKFASKNARYRGKYLEKHNVVKKIKK